MYSPPFTERGDEMNFSLMLQNIDRRQRFDLNFVLRMKFFILLRIIINCLFLNKYIDRRQTTDFNFVSKMKIFMLLKIIIYFIYYCFPAL